MTEKLMMYALGRGLEPQDARGCPRHRADRRPRSDYQFSAIVLGVVTSTPFRMRRSRVIARNTALPRRTFLRGIGATLALPLLDAMVPAFAARRPAPVTRLGFVYIPMGAHLPMWKPAVEGRLDRRCRRSLSPLTPFLDQVTVLSNLELKNAYSQGNHATANCTFLSGVRAKPTDGPDYELGTTVDQIAAAQIGRDTPLPSLELATDFNNLVGNCDNGFACVYMNTLAWSSPTTPLPTEANPRVVFERMFGEGGTAAERRAELQQERAAFSTGSSTTCDVSS